MGWSGILSDPGTTTGEMIKRHLWDYTVHGFESGQDDAFPGEDIHVVAASPLDNPAEVTAIVLYVKQVDRFLMVKAVPEEAGPAVACPPKILDMLTPTFHPEALWWRSASRDAAEAE